MPTNGQETINIIKAGLAMLLERADLLFCQFKVEKSFKFKIWLNKSCEVGYNVFYSEISNVRSDFEKKNESLS